MPDETENGIPDEARNWKATDASGSKESKESRHVNIDLNQQELKDLLEALTTESLRHTDYARKAETSEDAEFAIENAERTLKLIEKIRSKLA